MKVRSLEVRSLEVMNVEVVYVSDCCGSYMTDGHVQHGICPDCAEHCEVIKEEVVVSPACGG